MKFILTLLHKMLAGLISLLFIATPVASIPQKSITLGVANTKIRQEINITDAYMMSPSGSYATSSEIVALTDTTYTAPAYYFEVVASTTAGTTASVDLVYATSSKKAATISITGGNTYQRYRSSVFMPIGSSTIEYKIVLNNEAIGKGIIASRVIVLQNSGGGDLNNTETQIEIGSATTTANNTSTLPLQSPKYWYYDSTKWDASPTFYVEATYNVNVVASTTTYIVPGTYTYKASTGVSYAKIELWGAGGSGRCSTSAAGGGGGGGGAFALSTTAPIIASSHTVVVAATTTCDVATANNSTYDSTTIIAAGGTGSGGSATGGPGGTTAASTGDVEFAGGTGGTALGTNDTGGGGGGAAGKHGAGGNGSGGPTLSTSSGGGGGGGDGGSSAVNSAAGGNSTFGGGTGGIGGASANGSPGSSATEGGGGGGGSGATALQGGQGGSPGGGGGGGDAVQSGTLANGGRGQARITEYIGNVGIALQESDGTGDGFQNFTYKQMVVVSGITSTTTERVRSSSFTPISGRNYRLVASTTSATGSYNIYNAKIVVDQSNIVNSVEDSYDVANFTANGKTICGNAGSCVTSSQVAQAFTAGSTGTLTSIVWHIKKVFSPTGNVTASIYNITGTYGSTAVPTGAALATSDNIDSSTLSTTQTLVSFTFSGANQITLTSGNKYAAVITYSVDAGANNSIFVAEDTTSPTHGGNEADFLSGTWTANSGIDLIFYVYANVAGSGPTLLQPQYLLAPFKLPTGTALQTFLTQFDTTEWTTTNAYIAQSEAADGSSSVTGIYTSGGSLVTNSTISTIDNRATSTPICILISPFGTGTYDTKATTNNNDIYAERILVDVGSSQVASGCATASSAVPGPPATFLHMGGKILQNNIKLIQQ